MPRAPKFPQHSQKRLREMSARVDHFLAQLPKEFSLEETLKREKMDIDVPKEIAEKFTAVSAKEFTKKAPDSAQRIMWNKGAGFWARIERKHVFEATIKTIFKVVPFQANDRVVSLGSGPGIIETFLAKEVIPRGQLTLVDHANEMNRNARTFAAKNGVKNMKFVTGDMSRIPLRSGTADVVLAINSLQWTEHWERAISEMKRVLKDHEDSRVVISVNAIRGSHVRAKWGLDILQDELLLQGFIPLTAGVITTKGQKDILNVRAIVVAKLKKPKNLNP